MDGRFEIEVPADTLEFHHVSYLIGLYPVSGSKPIYVNVAMSETQQNFCIKPDHEALGKMEHLPVNIGITVKGLEYQ